MRSQSEKKSNRDEEHGETEKNKKEEKRVGCMREGHQKELVVLRPKRKKQLLAKFCEPEKKVGLIYHVLLQRQKEDKKPCDLTIGFFLECFGIFRFRGISPHESGNITLALINHMVSPVSSVVYVQV